MKQNLIYHSAAVGLASLVIGSVVSADRVFAEDTNDDSQPVNQEETTGSNTERVDKVVVDQTKQNTEEVNSQADEKDSTDGDSPEHKDTIWESAPPLARAQDIDTGNGTNASSDGVVRPHAQKLSKSKKHKKARTKSVKASKTNNLTSRSVVKSQNLARTANSGKSKSVKHKLDKDNVSTATNKNTLPQTGVQDSTELVYAGIASISLSMVGLIGVKSDKIKHKKFQKNL